MFAKLSFQFLALATLLSTGYAQLQDGRYQIISSGTGKLARNLPGGGHQGPTLNAIIFTDFSGVYSSWDVTKGDVEDGFNIVNAGSRNKAFAANATPGAPVQGNSEAGTEFEIEAAGQDTYVIKSLDADLLWTVGGEDVTLEHAKGTTSQRFVFKFVGAL